MLADDLDDLRHCALHLALAGTMTLWLALDRGLSIRRS